MTRIAIPVIAPGGTSSKIHEHFGKCDYIAIIDTDGDKVASINFIQDSLTKRNRIRGKIIVDNNVEVVIANDIGPHMTEEFLENGIRLYKWASGTIQDALDDHQAGKLKEIFSIDDLY